MASLTDSNEFSIVISNQFRLFFQVNATDMDAGSDGKIIYEIDKGDQDQEFRINATTGVITLIRSLESSSDRILSVTASSGRQSVQTFISIEITGTVSLEYVSPDFRP